MSIQSDNVYPKLILDAVTSAPSAPSNDNWKLYAMPNGIFARSSNTTVGPFGTAGGGGTGQGLVDYGFVRYTGGDITCDANTVWEDLGISDITLTASTGDTIEVAFSAWANNSTAVQLHFDCVTIVSASPVNSIGSGGTPSDSNVGVAAWAIASSAAGKSGGSVMYTLQSGDISGGTVTLRMRDKPNGSTDRVIGGTAVSPICFTAKNLGAAL